MKPDKFLYTDGYNVIVTNRRLIVKNTRYLLKGILDFGLAVLKPQRLPGLLLILLGGFLITDVFLKIIPPFLLDKLSIPATYFTIDVQILAGAGIAVIGSIYMLTVRKRYALRIATAEGDKDVVVSKHKEDVNKILTAIRQAKLAAFGSKQ